MSNGDFGYDPDPAELDQPYPPQTGRRAAAVRPTSPGTTMPPRPTPRPPRPWEPRPWEPRPWESGYVEGEPLASRDTRFDQEPWPTDGARLRPGDRRSSTRRDGPWWDPDSWPGWRRWLIPVAVALLAALIGAALVLLTGSHAGPSAASGPWITW